MAKERKIIGSVSLAKEVGKQCMLPETHAKLFMNVLCETIEEHIHKGNIVVLTGLGRFTFREHAKEAVSRMTGDVIPPHDQLIFKPHAELARKVRVLTRKV